MKHLIGLLITGLITAAMGFTLSGSLNPGIRADASVKEQQVVDGQAVPAPDNPTPSQPAVPAAPAAGATLYQVYGSYEFQPTDSNLTYAPYGAAMYAVTVPGGTPSFKCPLHLPNGAQVSRVSFYVVDNSAAANMTLQFYRSEPAANTSQYEIGFVTTAGLPTSTAVQTVTIYGAPILAMIDTLHYAYSLRYQPSIAGSLHMLVGARVEYTAPSAYLPLVMK